MHGQKVRQNWTGKRSRCILPSHMHDLSRCANIFKHPFFQHRGFNFFGGSLLTALGGVHSVLMLPACE